MKPHFVIRLRHSLNVVPIHWSTAITNDTKLPEKSLQALDEVMNKYSLSYFIAQEYLSKTKDLWTKEEMMSAFDRTYRIILKENRSIPLQLIEELRLLPIVESVRMANIANVTLPRAAALDFQAERARYDNARKSIYLEEAHMFTKGHEEIKIAVLDTGVWAGHYEYAKNLLNGFDFVDIIDGTPEAMADHLNRTEGVFGGDFKGIDEDYNDNLVGHGTHVAGIISAQGHNMSIGVAPKCKVIPVKVLAALKQGDKYVGAGLVDNINNGIKWAIDHGATVINMSLGIRNEGGGLPHEEVIQYAKEKNVTVVAASGNDGTDQAYYPGALPHVIAVGALDDNQNIAFYSSFGKHVSFVAPGSNIYSSFINNGYSHSTGTSHASPFVAGAVALLQSYALERGVRLKDTQIKYLLKHTADRPFKGFKNNKWGFGKLNIVDALKLLKHKLN